VKASVFETIKRAEDFVREQGNPSLANELYGLGCMLGGPTEMPPFKLAPPEVLAAADAELARRRATGDYPTCRRRARRP
jgi:hypothetical protein